MLYGQHAPGSRFFIEEEPMEMGKIEGRGSFGESEKLGLKEIEDIVLSIPGQVYFFEYEWRCRSRDRGNSDEIGTIFIEMPFEKDLQRQAGMFTMIF